jgi:type II secretory pathway component GspD/PulD (secretin)
LSDITPEMTLSEAIDKIRDSVDPPLKIVVRWKDLEENAYIERDTVIGMQGLSGIPVGKGLKELLDSISGGVTKIDYIVDDGIITVATKESLPNKLVTQAYDITELIGMPASYRAELSTQEDARSSQSTTSTSADQMEQERTDNAATIIQMIQETVAPDTWLLNGGEGTISSHGNRLVISQTPQVHEQVQKLLTVDLRESLGQQVSIEARFLFVTENFLEDIGFNMTMNVSPFGKFGRMIFQQDSYTYSKPTTTGISGSLADTGTSNPAITLDGGTSYGNYLDDLSLSFFLRATQAHRDAKMLTAPRVTVLSGESASIRVSKEIAYVSDYDFQDITSSGDSQPTRVIADPQTETETGGVVLNVTPTISADKKYVILEISTNYTKLTFADFTVSSSTSGEGYPIQLPELEVAEVQTRVSVPDGGTLLIGGQKLGAEINKEAGVPGLSKTPIIGRLFSNRSKIKDQDILLVLVKPTIILQDEAEREYFAPLE